MATISSTGVGSGLNINSLVRELVAAERAAPDKRMAREDAKLTTEFTALAALKGALSGFQIAVSGLKYESSLQMRKATVGDPQAFAATVNSAASPGRYDVEVVQLATAARTGSAAYAAGPSSIVGSGTLSIGVGERAFSIEVAAGSTLAQIRDAINTTPGNPGVHATLIRDSSGTGSHLVLSSTATGAENALSISATGADAGLAQLAQDLQNFDAARDVAAQDAIVFVSGYEIRSPANTVTGALDGVTLNLLAAEEGRLVSLNIERDDAAVLAKLESFVSGFNTVAQQIATLSRYDSTTRTAGPLLGDAMLRGIDAQLRRIISDAVPGAGGASLASLGISTTATGTLQLDTERFRSALAADPAAVSRMFSSESGVAVRLGSFLDERLASTGELVARDQRIVDRRRGLQDQSAALDARMQIIEARYMKQFTALDTMLAQMQTTSNFLGQQLDGLANLNSGRR